MCHRDTAVLIIPELFHTDPGDLGERLFPKILHQFSHTFQSIQSGHDEIQSFFFEITVLFVLFLHSIRQSHSSAEIISCHLCDQHRGRDRILVPHIIAHHIAVAFLISENILIGTFPFPLCDPFRHEFETSEGIFHVDFVSPADFLCHLRSDDTLYRAGIVRHSIRAATGFDDIVQQQHTHLVSGNGDILLPLPYQNTDAVSIRIGTDNDVAAYFSGKFHRQSKTFRVFRVRARHGGECTVDHHLLLNRIEMADPEATERFRNKLIAASVEGSIHDFEAICHRRNGFAVDRLSEDTFEVGFVRFLIQKDDLSLLHRLVIITG